MAQETSGEFDILINLRDQRMSMLGDLEDTPAARKLLDERCVCMGGIHSHWTIDALQATVVPAGVELWKHIVEKHLSGCHLHYLDDQLGCILQFDKLYRDTYLHHTFAEHE